MALQQGGQDERLQQYISSLEQTDDNLSHQCSYNHKSPLSNQGLASPPTMTLPLIHRVNPAVILPVVDNDCAHPVGIGVNLALWQKVPAKVSDMVHSQRHGWKLLQQLKNVAVHSLMN